MLQYVRVNLFETFLVYFSKFLEEPFNGLDEELKKDIYPDVKKILNDNKITTIMVSHNTSEVKNLSDRIFNLENGALKEL